MPIANKILKTKLYFQCLGGPEAWMSPDNPQGFSGIPVPDVLEYCRSGVDGTVIMVSVPEDPENPTEPEKDEFRASCEESIKPIFEAAVGINGPGDNAWALVQPGWPTILSNPAWIWGIQAVAFRLGLQEVDESETRTGDVEPFVQEYEPESSDGTTTHVYGRYMIVFELN